MYDSLKVILLGFGIWSKKSCSLEDGFVVSSFLFFVLRWSSSEIMIKNYFLKYFLVLNILK